MKIAVIGSGISGLSCAWLLAHKHAVTVFEQQHYAGGHSNAVDVTLDGLRYPVDTGFLVFNEQTYPNLLNLFAVLGVEYANTDMGFSVRLPHENIEWAGSNIGTLFAQKRNLLRPSFWLMIKDILRFNKEAPELLIQAQKHQYTLGQLLQVGGYSKAFAEWYLLPMGAAIWSTPPAGMEDFPAQSFLQFCLNHGLLQVNNRPQWLTVKGSSREYVKRLCAGIGDVRLNTAITKVERSAHGVIVHTQTESLHFDAVVMACHSDQTLSLLADASAQEQAILSAVRYAPNKAYLHTDQSVMPARRQAWSAWNYYTAKTPDRQRPVAVTYWLNKLQPLPFSTPLFVTLNPPEPIEPSTILAEFDYAHPQLDAAAYDAQQKLSAIQGLGGVYYCGAWTGYGFHEDGLKAGLRVAKLLNANIPWQAIL
ncbi:NAD(P)/FAD-dependent oxidoreductase [Agitococcus lubricus]|uniref:Putative NAD/FAD-binding protein n=1 Tax=Agitococcus lubricus TaxID=1077255 RepID=A0A2T5IVJ3_9GAMM|nr:FAD-dependent oxidoreductase [Agitococcus lubricus]PTQ87906.1 putative NAD/FAD-binding protein [Agitococcus lubricus]